MLLDHEGPRERIASLGPAALAVDELMGLVLTGGAGGRQPAGEILEKAGGLARLARATPADLRRLGVSPVRTATLCAAFELGRRVAQAEAPPGLAIRSAGAAFEFLRPRLGHLPHEVFVVLLLDVRLRVLRDVRVAEGTGWSCAVHPRDALAPALREGAAAVVFAHNHPSGDPTPSQEDRELTRRLLRACELMGVRAVDHVVVSADRYASLRELGLFE
ncbi:MAG TPA: DNA repair protein RadC [Myxococcales bacterium]|jgi:DNA repair protein RadC|nr:DNA repair protein RadC [Myxococcales bacterium]